MATAMNAKKQIEDLQREIGNLRLSSEAPEAIQRHLRALNNELENYKRQQRRIPLNRRSSLIAIVQPTPPPQVQLTPQERSVWGTFFRYHLSLLQYSGWVNRGEWLHMADVAADMTGARYGGGQIVPELIEDAPFDGTLYGRRNGLWVPVAPEPPSTTGTYVWDGDTQTWVPTQSALGVTDGSDAAPGQVGEVIEIGSPAILPVPIVLNTSPGTWTTLVSAVLTAGDWDVTGDVYLSISAPMSDVVLGLGQLSTVVGPPDIGYGSFLALQTNFATAAAALATHRFSLTVPTTVYVMGALTALNAADLAIPATGAAMLHARRMR